MKLLHFITNYLMFFIVIALLLCMIPIVLMCPFFSKELRSDMAAAFYWKDEGRMGKWFP